MIIIVNVSVVAGKMKENGGKKMLENSGAKCFTRISVLYSFA